MTKVEGQVVKVGDWVRFKSDVEQAGCIARIDGDRLFLEAGPNGFEGDYIGGQKKTVQSARDCWIEG